MSQFDSEDDDFEVSKGTNSVKRQPYNWKLLTVPELVACMDEIRSHLPPLSLKDINLEEEMLLQYHSLRALQNDVLEDEKIALNQRAQVANSVAAALGKLADLQTDVYTQERHKRIEGIMIKLLSKLPEDVAQTFLVEYEKALKAASK